MARSHRAFVLQATVLDAGFAKGFEKLEGGAVGVHLRAKVAGDAMPLHLLVILPKGDRLAGFTRKLRPGDQVVVEGRATEVPLSDRLGVVLVMVTAARRMEWVSGRRHRNSDQTTAGLDAVDSPAGPAVRDSPTATGRGPKEWVLAPASQRHPGREG